VKGWEGWCSSSRAVARARCDGKCTSEAAAGGWSGGLLWMLAAYMGRAWFAEACAHRQASAQRTSTALSARSSVASVASCRISWTAPCANRRRTRSQSRKAHPTTTQDLWKRPGRIKLGMIAPNEYAFGCVAGRVPCARARAPTPTARRRRRQLAQMVAKLVATRWVVFRPRCWRELLPPPMPSPSPTAWCRSRELPLRAVPAAAPPILNTCRQ